MVVVLSINLLVLWGEGIVPSWYWPLVFFHTLLMPHLAYYFSTHRDHESYNLIFDVTLYAFYLAAWGYNPFLAAVFIATSNLTLISLGGWHRLMISGMMQLMGACMGGFITGFYFRPQLDLVPMLVATAGFFAFMIGVGWLMHNIHQRLHSTRRDLKDRHNELADINALAMAVNSQLTIDSIIAHLLKTLEKIYPLEAIYFLSHEQEQGCLKVSGIYGQAISYKERTAFEALTFDLALDADSIFVMGLAQKRIINLSFINKNLVDAGAAIDKKLYDIKPCVSIIYFPVYIDNVVVGGLAFINHEHQCVIKKPDLKRISDYLIQVGTAIKNANLINQLQAAKEQALLAQKKAEASEEAKSRFLANMSHEIRTPMTAILGYSEALQDANVSAIERKQFVDIIMNSGKHLLSMINSVLDISKIEASKVHIEKINIDVVHILGDIENYVKLKASEKNIDYQVIVKYPVPSQIKNDPTRLKQVLLNLCNNAIKFTDKGVITITLSWPQYDRLKVIVQDTGIGLDEQECNHVFEAFAQADTSTTRLYGGTGLGLTISKSLAVLMGGDLEVESIKGQGSQFILTLDTGENIGSLIEGPTAWQQLKRSRYSQVKKNKTPELSGHVLIADDNPVNQQIIKRLVELSGLTADLVDNGLKAFQAVEKQDYDLIFLDMQMPVMGGEQAAEKIKALGVSAPMVAFTANVMAHQIQSYLQAGFVDVIEKPIDKEKLYSVLSHFIQPKKSNLNTIMIVDDDDISGMILSRQIKKYDAGLEVIRVSNGQQALDAVGATTIDMVFMDMEMPVMSGLEATRKLREMGFVRPIYMVTGHVDLEFKSLCLAAGATGHLPKPLGNVGMHNILASY